MRLGDILFRKGEPSDAGYFILSGSFQMEDPARPGSQKVILPYTLIGEMALFTNTDRPATIVAREPSTVMKIGRHVFHRVLKEYPKTAVCIRAALEARLVGLSDSLVKRSL
jgi:CRP-like cAMP-binding protein